SFVKDIQRSHCLVKLYLPTFFSNLSYEMLRESVYDLIKLCGSSNEASFPIYTLKFLQVCFAKEESVSSKKDNFIYGITKASNYYSLYFLKIEKPKNLLQKRSTTNFSLFNLYS